MKHSLNSNLKACLMAVIALLLSTAVQAQDISKYLKAGDKFLQNKLYNRALEEYEKAYDINKASPELHYRMGQAYLGSPTKYKAEQFLAKAVELTTRPSDDLLYDYARALHFNHQWDQAIEYYQKSDRLGKNRPRTIRRVEECNYGKALSDKPVNSRITNMGNLINSPYAEYLPFVTADQQKMYYTTRRPVGEGAKRADDGQYFEEVMFTYNRGGAWMPPAALPEPINSSDHDACVGISAYGQTMFLYKGTNGGDIYISKHEKDRWTKPEPFPFNTTGFESSVCLSNDGKRLFFVSDRFGNKDIFVCNMVKGKWGAPYKLLGSINTYLDEESPYLHSDGKTLYYSSKGPGSMGGYDIFKVELNGVFGTGTPQNLGFPINTAGDDLYFTLSPDAKTAYYASEKESGYGRQDIYMITIPETGPKPELALIKGKISAEDKAKGKNAKVTVTDNEANEVVTSFEPNEETGEFAVPLPSGKNYGVTIERDGHLFYSENVTLAKGEAFKELKREVKLPAIKEGAKMVLRNLFFETGKAELQATSIPELERVVKLMKQNPETKIEISGHTDNTGSDALNKKLSEARAQSVKDFIIGKGIAGGRLVSIGYSSQKPIADNNTEEGRAQNRRTELTVIK